MLEIINDYKVKAAKKNMKVEVMGTSVRMKNLEKLEHSTPKYHYQQLFKNNSGVKIGYRSRLF